MTQAVVFVNLVVGTSSQPGSSSLLGSLQTPAISLIGTLQAPARDLVLTLKAYVQKLEEEAGSA